MAEAVTIAASRAATATVPASRVRFRPTFYGIRSIALIGLVVFAFSQTVPDDLSTPGFPVFLYAEYVRPRPRAPKPRR
jgi:hypothetical protein